MIALKTIKKILLTKIYMWILLLVVALSGLVWIQGYLSANNQATVSVSSTVQYLEEVNEVVFLNAGIQKVVTSEEASDFFGQTIPLSKKTALVILRYKAKLGIKEAVSIQKTGDQSYTVKVPTFQVIGVELDPDHPYELYDRSGELLSFATKEVDTGKLVTQELSTKEQEKYLEQYTESLKESAAEYYQTLFKALNPEIELTVLF